MTAWKEAAYLLGIKDPPPIWPDKFEPYQLVKLQVMQMGMTWKEYNQHPKKKELSAKITVALRPPCDLVHTVTIEPGRAVINGRISLAGSKRFATNWGTWDNPSRNEYGERVYLQPAAPPRPPDSTVVHVTAPAFKAWLAAKGVEPSEFVSDWFAAAGLNAEPLAVVAAPDPAAPPAPSHLKKSALIAALEHEWPSIEADISDATRNGLKDAAHAGQHGLWDADKARAWAVCKGKIKQARAVDPLAAVWPGTSRINTLRH